MIDKIIGNILMGLISLSLISSGQVYAAWYQAQGQALIINGDKQLAKQQATEEAIRQALLFAGASITSSQTLTNGLLQRDALQVNASGEVKRVEKVSERWHDDYVTVTIRADIFPKKRQCLQSDALKSIVAAPFSVRDPSQFLDGDIQAFNHSLVLQLQNAIKHYNGNVSLDHITPFTVSWVNSRNQQQASSLGKQYDAQLALFGHIEDVSVVRTVSTWNPFTQPEAERRLAFRIRLIDTINNAVLLDKAYQMKSAWEYKVHEKVDTGSDFFWQSAYGKTIQREISLIVEDVAHAVECQPTTGRVLSVANNQISINLGKMHGLEMGDILSLYQMQTLTDDRGLHYQQYNLHPEKLIVTQINYDNAVMVAENGGLLGNIQPNDFVIHN
ncbi:hypothetical protein DRW07_16620 [Alteromonas sediminis]|uniref:Flagellar biosynthesis protein FlgT n=1 Tax=Alteromonas sediminis TaxID=2259342 RepID=A0A3N5XX51_9ALTE|nr:flagellar assembly protein T N-terminal domain-containing protein [Alteromonas sediminis]RPJ64943.1 hypothetical protein DRW07_16620 [Alteromonas sediminis]